MSLEELQAVDNIQSKISQLTQEPIYDYENLTLGSFEGMVVYMHRRPISLLFEDIDVELDSSVIQTAHFSIFLTIEERYIRNVEVIVKNPNRPIHDQIDRITNVFELSKTYCDGRPKDYFLCLIKDEEESILFPIDEKGNEMSLIDYGVQPGDHLSIVHNVCTG